MGKFHKLNPVPALFDLSELSSSVERPADLGEREWDKLQKTQPLMEEDGGRREKPGWGAKKRAEDHLKWVLPFVPADDIRGELPSDIRAVREDVLGDLIRDEDGVVRLRYGWHPLMKRWCEFTMVRRPDQGERGQLWQVCYIYMKDPQPKVLPTDLNSDIAHRHYRGLIGEYSLPTREDFENIRRYGARHQKLGTHMQRLERLSEPLRAQENESNRQLDDRGRAHCDYYANEAIDLANRRAGSGWHMRTTWIDDKSPGATEYKEGIKFKKTIKNGYTIIEKRTEEEIQELRALEQRAADFLAEKQADKKKRTLEFVRREVVDEKAIDKTLPDVKVKPMEKLRIPKKETV